MSFRILFLGVNASNGIIRMLFLPLCYLLLLSPFILAVAWYFGFDQTLQNYLPAHFSWLDLLPQICLSAVFLLLPTRLISGFGGAGKSKNERKRRVQSLPYWLPGLRNLDSIVLDGDRWLKSIRESSITSIIAYGAAGAKHNVILSDPLLQQVYKNWSSLDEARSINWALLRNAFHMPKNAESQHGDLSQAIAKTINSEMFTGNLMEGLISASLNTLSESLPDFITFNSSIVDQMQWERVSNIELTDGTSEAECDLFTLVNEFCCNAILPSVMGAQFTESYQLLATDLAAFNQQFWALALGLPRLSPIKGLPGAALSQKRLLYNFTKLFNDLTNPPVKRVPDDDESVSGGEDTDADTSTPLTKLNELFTKHDVPLDVRAAVSFQLIHSIIAEIVPIVFWTLLHVYSSSNTQDTSSANEAPLLKIKAETKTWAQAIQPPSIHPSFPAPPEIRFASAQEALSAKSFPYLRSCINESQRLYNSPISTYLITKPITLEEEGIARAGEEEQWELDVGSYLDIGLSQSLINSSPADHASPNTFKPDRFVNTAAPSSVISPVDPSNQYKSALLIALIAGIVQLWEITPAPRKTFFEHMQEARDEASIGAAALSGEQKAAKEEAQAEKAKKARKEGKWIIPKAVDGATVKIPKSDVRVRIRRREGLPASKIVRRIG
ncbi:Nn.00g068660.m01.CDS01 [Neocucurbitaria sp. VM-36]